MSKGGRAMRAMWKGAVSFGLVSIGVKLYSATDERDIRFHQIHVTSNTSTRLWRGLCCRAWRHFGYVLWPQAENELAALNGMNAFDQFGGKR